MGRHGALRGPGRGGAAPEPRAVRGRRHVHHPQDARRPARRDHPRQAVLREEAQLLGLPRLPGRSAGACDRREGGLLQGRGGRGVQGAAAAYRGGGAAAGRAPGAGRREGRRGRCAVRWYGRAPGPGRPAELRAGRPAGRGPAPRGRHHGQPERRPERPAAPDGHLRPAHRYAGAGDPRLHGRGLRRGRGRHRGDAEGARSHRGGRRGGPEGPRHRAGGEVPAVPRRGLPL